MNQYDHEKNYVPHSMAGGAIIGAILGGPVGAFVGGLIGGIIGLGISEDNGEWCDMASKRKTTDLVARLVGTFIVIILFYYLAFPAVLNFINGVEQFVGSSEFLIGALFGSFAVIFIIALTQRRFRMF